MRLRLIKQFIKQLVIYKYKKLSYRRGTARRTMSVEIMSTLLHNCTKHRIWKACNRRTSFKVTQGHRKWCDSIGHISFLLVVCSNNVCTLNHSRDIATFTVYVTDCDLEMLKLQAACAFRFTCKRIVFNTRYISRGTGVTKVTNSNT